MDTVSHQTDGMMSARDSFWKTLHKTPERHGKIGGSFGRGDMSEGDIPI